MTDCSSIHESTSSSSDLNSHHGAMSKIRTVRLIRPHTGNRNNLTLGHPPFSSYGFSLRGGREFGTGFFVSSVVKGSEADLKGLQVGDQIVRVGGSTGSYRVDDAVHKELSQFIINQDRLTLKVRGKSSAAENVSISQTIFFLWFVLSEFIFCAHYIISRFGNVSFLIYFITFLSVQIHDKWAEWKISFGLWRFSVVFLCFTSIVHKQLNSYVAIMNKGCELRAASLPCNAHFVH